jgi:hypothetical protein
MPHGRRSRAQAGSSALSTDAPDDEAFRLVAIRHAATPEGCAGRDWLLYEISQGRNTITGYRRGDIKAATAEVEKIVVGLNERRMSKKGRQGPPKPKPGAAAAVAAPAKDADAD